MCGTDHHPIADMSTEDEVGYPSVSALTEGTTEEDMLCALPWGGHLIDGSDNSAARRFKSFTKRVLKKVDSLLIHQPLEQLSPTKSRLLKWSKQLVA